jgi:hypothetical protein
VENHATIAMGEEQLSAFASFTAQPGPFNLWSLPVAPRVTIETGTQLLEAALLSSGTFSWLALSGTFPVQPTTKIGVVYTTPTFFPEKAAGVFGVAESFVNIKAPIQHQRTVNLCGFHLPHQGRGSGDQRQRRARLV